MFQDIRHRLLADIFRHSRGFVLSKACKTHGIPDVYNLDGNVQGNLHQISVFILHLIQLVDVHLLPQKFLRRYIGRILSLWIIQLVYAL